MINHKKKGKKERIEGRGEEDELSSDVLFMPRGGVESRCEEG